jgi:hypothetical protein
LQAGTAGGPQGRTGSKEEVRYMCCTNVLPWLTEETKFQVSCSRSGRLINHKGLSTREMDPALGLISVAIQKA